jgi:serine protease DegQ
MVTFYDGQQGEARVAWVAPAGIDIAIIICPVVGLEYDQITASSELVGASSKVFAIGNPMALHWTYTEGVISGVRSQALGLQDIQLYQTQTPINQGNSGGGLYTEDGILIGVSSSTLDKSVAEGLSFAISTHSILRLLHEQADKYFGSLALQEEAPTSAPDEEEEPAE